MRYRFNVESHAPTFLYGFYSMGVKPRDMIGRVSLEIDACQLALAMGGAGNINVKEPQRWSSPFAKESHMAQLLVAIVLLSSFLLFGCSSNLESVGLGAVGGAAAGAVGRGL
jgi:hypothetical protein